MISPVRLLSLIVCTLCSAALHAREPAVGIEKRIPWTASRITGSPEPPAPFVSERVFAGLTFDKPLELDHLPGTNRLAVGELDGKIWSFENREGVKERDLLFDLRALHTDVKRILAFTFHPDFEKNGYFYLTYAYKDGLPDGTHVSRFTVRKTDPPAVDPASERVIITWKSGGHNGCCLKFGPDGCLYVSAGDAGPAFPPDPLRSGQDIGTLPSTIFRIDVDHPEGDRSYRIPADNPFVGTRDARGEVWAYGFRNPWRMCFDPRTGDLWVGDVGWEMWEMIYRVKKGGNYGWSVVEGPQVVHRERPQGPTPILPPTIQHSHIESRSITGGFVYHGKRLKELAGRYVYGDYVTGKIWAARFNAEKVLDVEEIADTPLALVSFGLDAAGELYLLDHEGSIHRLVPNPRRSRNEEFPRRLSETGLFASVKDHRVAPGVIPYSIRAEPWQDHTTAERFVAVPGEGKLGLWEKSNLQIGFIKGDWKFPTDSVLVKTISIETQQGNPASRRRLETQLFHYDVDTWRAYTFIWNDDQTDAELADAAGSSRTFTIKDASAPGGARAQTWRYASRSECLLCHSTRGGSIYGFKPNQLDRRHDYNGVVADQLATLEHIGLFAQPVAENRKPIPDPHDASADLEARARAYLHVNCAHCHRRGGGGTAAMDVQYEFTLKQTNLLEARPTQGTFGLFASQVLAPGDPYRSVLYYRMAKLGRGRMPHFGSTVVDERGLRLIHDWIGQMPPQATTETAARLGALRDRQRELLARLARSPDLPAEKAGTLLSELLSQTSGALMLLHAIDDNRLSMTARERAIAAGTGHAEAVVRDLFERFLPEEKRTRRLGTAIDRAALLAIEGDAGRGRAMFLHSQTVQCRNCHTLDGKGHELGPDLGTIGKKYDRAALLENILEPSRNIDPKYVPYLIETAEGKVFSGMLIEKSETEVVLKDAQLKEIRVPVKSIDLMTPLQRSIMPELLLGDMTAEEAADLLAFLASLK